MRLLRSYERMAQQYHPCSECGFNIQPGEEYRGEIFVNKIPKLFFVVKSHLYDCTYDPTKEEKSELEEKVRMAA